MLTYPLTNASYVPNQLLIIYLILPVRQYRLLRYGFVTPCGRELLSVGSDLQSPATPSCPVKCEANRRFISRGEPPANASLFPFLENMLSAHKGLPAWTNSFGQVTLLNQRTYIASCNIYSTFIIQGTHNVYKSQPHKAQRIPKLRFIYLTLGTSGWATVQQWNQTEKWQNKKIANTQSKSVSAHPTTITSLPHTCFFTTMTTL